MTKHSITFGGLDSAFFDIWLSGEGTFAAPERDVKKVSVPGRNGDLMIDGGKWENIDVTYPAYIHTDFFNKFEDFRKEICRKRGYQRLEDTYHPNEFRMGILTDGLNPGNFVNFYRSGQFDITFNCKPQRFLKSGEQPIQILSPVVFTNTMSTMILPVYEDVKVTAHSADTLTVTLETFDTNKAQLSTQSVTLTEGQSHTFSFQTTDIFFRITFSGYEEPDEASVTIQTTTLNGGTPIALNAEMGQSIKITNPTGYAAKPLIKIYSSTSPSMAITNYVGGEREDFYEFHVNATPSDEMTIDCDLQYVYDDDKNNLTRYLFLSTAESAIGEGLTFPQLGEGEIEFHSYYTSNIGLGLIEIYPGWWKL